MPSSEAGNSIKAVVGALMRRRLLFVGMVAMCLSLAALYVFLSPRVYRASSTLVVESDRASDPLGMSGLVHEDPSVLVELQVLKSMDLATRVADALMEHGGETIDDLPIMQKEDGPQRDRVQLARKLVRRIEVDQVRRDVGVIEIGFRSTSPQEAQLVSNLYATHYAERNLESSRLKAGGLRAFVEGQLVEQQDRLNEVEQRLAAFQQTENAFTLDEDARRLSAQMTDVQTMLDLASVEFEMAGAQLQSLESEYETIEPNLAARVSSAGLEKEIATLQEEIAQLEFDIDRKYAKNPILHGNESSDKGLLALISQTEALKEQVRRKADRYVNDVMSSGGIDPENASSASSIPSALSYVSSLRRSITDKKIERAALKARIDVLSRRFQKYEKEFDRIPAQARSIAALERDRGSSEQLSQWLQEKYEEARIAEAAEFGRVSILDVAYVPSEPVAPRTLYALLFGGLLGILMGIGAVLTRELLDESVLSPDEVQRAGVPLLGTVPLIRGRGTSLSTQTKSLVVTCLPEGTAATSIQHVVTRLDASESAQCLVLMVTSPIQGEGKTTIACNVAAGLAAAGHRTLILDANVWSPQVHRILDVSRSPGLTDLLFESALMKEAICQTGVPNLFTLPVGASRSGQFTLLASRDFEALMAYLRTSFDRIVIDAPGINGQGSSLGLVPLADKVIVVARSGVTAEGQLLSSLRDLSSGIDHDTEVATVLNALDSRSVFGRYSSRRLYGTHGKPESGSPRLESSGIRNPLATKVAISERGVSSGDGVADQEPVLASPYEPPQV